MGKTVFFYEIPLDTAGRVERGEVKADDSKDALRLLRLKYMRPDLPKGTVVKPKTEADREAKAEKSAKLRALLAVLSGHHQWLKGEAGGERGDLAGYDLSGLELRGSNFADAELAGANLTGADLREASFRGANLVSANLCGADLRGANLGRADLSDADLRDAILTGVEFEGADLWRANLIGCVISPKALHAALRCSTRKSSSQKKPANMNLKR